MNKTKRSKITSSAKLKTMIFSVIVAIAVWLVAVYVDDPSITVTANGIMTRIVNEDVLSEKGLVIKNKDKLPTFSVRVNGKRSNLMNYMNRITADFNVEGIDAAGEYTLEGTIALPNTTLSLAKRGNATITINVADVAKKTVKVYANQSGANKDYIIKSIPMEAETVISGAEDEVEKIAYAAVGVDISGATSDYTSYGDVFFCDADGNKLTDVTSVVPERRTFKVENKIYQKVVAKVRCELSEEIAESFILDENNTVVSPKEIEVGILKGTKIEFVNVVIDKNLLGEQTLRASTDIENVYIPYANSEVAVTAKLQKITEKTLELKIGDMNIADGFKAEYDENVSVVVKCGENVQAQNIRSVLDLKNLAEGEHYVKLQVTGDAVISSEEKYIPVKITR